MEDARHCDACGAYLAGPFDPGIVLTYEPSPEEDLGADDVTVTVRGWICPACGLVHWYAADQELGKLEMIAPEQEAGEKPDTNYERRTQMMRMLRRVRRM
jgi:hypothetical protein